MSLTTALLSQTQIKLWLPWSQNLDPEWYIAAALNAQYLDLPCILGDDFIAELQTQIEDDTLTTANEALLDNLAPYLANLAAVAALDGLRVRIQGAGALMSNAKEDTPATLPDLDTIRLNCNRMKDVYRERFLKWLDTNKADYPLLPTDSACGTCSNSSDVVFGVSFRPKRYS